MNQRTQCCFYSFLGFCVVTVQLLTSTALADNPNDILVIVNNAVAGSSISQDELKAIFLRKKNSFHGNKITPINAKHDTTLRRDFRNAVVKMSESDEGIYWEKKKIKKGISAPAEFRDLLKAIFYLKSSMGYCYRKQFKRRVGKIILVIPYGSAH